MTKKAQVRIDGTAKTVAARRQDFKLIRGDKKDEPKPAALKGEFNL
jgi:hypothetical protein